MRAVSRVLLPMVQDHLLARCHGVAEPLLFHSKISNRIRAASQRSSHLTHMRAVAPKADYSKKCPPHAIAFPHDQGPWWYILLVSGPCENINDAARYGRLVWVGILTILTCDLFSLAFICSSTAENI